MMYFELRESLLCRKLNLFQSVAFLNMPLIQLSQYFQGTDILLSGTFPLSVQCLPQLPFQWQAIEVSMDQE